MKLSEAIRLGEFAAHPAYGEWIETYDDGTCGACAVGRACLAAGYVSETKRKREDVSALASYMKKMWPWTATWDGKNPFTGWPDSQFGYYNPVLGMMSDLYEKSEWSMQKIAEWVATIEPQEATIEPKEVKSAPAVEPAHQAIGG